MLHMNEIIKLIQGRTVYKIETMADTDPQTGLKEYLLFDLFCDDGTIINLLPYVRYGQPEDANARCYLGFVDMILHKSS